MRTLVSKKNIRAAAVFFIAADYMIFGLYGYTGTHTSTEIKETVSPLSFFPVPENSWVGDPVPFYNKHTGSFYIYYLDDLRDGAQGFHPWALFTTKDFLHFSDKGVVIPYTDAPRADDLALGTGSIIRDSEGRYHAFYTGHNPSRIPREAIMQAVSSDGIKWEKLPKYTFRGNSATLSGVPYGDYDFRDPFVLQEKDNGTYWMLITTAVDGKGVIARFMSDDLYHWHDCGVFFKNDMGNGDNLECPSLIHFGRYWYLAFSDQGTGRMVHYRIAEEPDGPFRKPETDELDGSGFYAGRLESDGTHLYVFGWNATKKDFDDMQDYAWGGSLVVHQLKQAPDGTLFSVPPFSSDTVLTNKRELHPVTTGKTVSAVKNGYTFGGDGYDDILYENIPETPCIITVSFRETGNISPEKFGFCFGSDYTKLYLTCDPANRRIEFFNGKNHMEQSLPESYIDCRSPGDGVWKCTLLIDNSVAVLYVNGQSALTARIHTMSGNPWSIFSCNGEIAVTGVSIQQ